MNDLYLEDPTILAHSNIFDQLLIDLFWDRIPQDETQYQNYVNELISLHCENISIDRDQLADSIIERIRQMKGHIVDPIEQ